MTPSPPDEALHFRGKTLTPESPRPLHIPEPANIPVLENQMDPVFNDTSTYQRSEYEQQQQPQSQPQENGWSGSRKDGQDGLSRDTGSLQQQQPGNPVMNDTSVPVTNFYSPHQAGSEHGAHVNPGQAYPEASHSHAPPVVPVSQRYATAGEISTTNNPAQSARLGDAKEGTDSNLAGVNFQTLLDNLSHPPAGASANASPLAEGSSLHQAPNDESIQGLPVRPYQDPSTQPNYYPSSDDISYHQHPGPFNTTSSAYAAQPSNHAQQPFAPSMSPGGAPGTESRAGNLPPPPGATFQHNASSGAESQASQEALAQAARKGRTEKQPLRSVKGSDDDAPWGPEVQKKYDEFLHDERVYVTEGLWDRFPMGSRLFVGQYRLYHVLQARLTDIFSHSRQPSD